MAAVASRVNAVRTDENTADVRESTVQGRSTLALSESPR